MEPKHRIPHDDWADQDLLTRAEAAGRLAAEIEGVEAQLATAPGDQVLERRLEALKQAYAQLAGDHD